MPQPLPKTLNEARTQVLGALRVPDDGANAPDLLVSIVAALNEAQYELATEFPWQARDRLLDITTAAGTPWVDLPATVDRQAIRSCSWIDSSGETVLADGVSDELYDLSGVPRRYGLLPTTGVQLVTVSAGGSGYVDGASLEFAGGAPARTAAGTISVAGGAITAATLSDSGSEYGAAPTVTAPTGSGATLVATLATIMQVYVQPQPAEAGTLRVRYQQDLGTLLSADSDELLLPFWPVVLWAAASIAEVLMPQKAPGLRARAVRAVDAEKRRQHQRVSFSLVPPSRT